MAEDKKPVAEDIENVAAKHHPHRHRGVLHAVAELLVGIEQHLRQQAQQQNKHIGTHQRQKFGRQPKPWHCHHQQCGKKHQQHSHCRTRKESVLQLAGNIVQPAFSKQSTNYRRQPIRKTQASYDEQAQDIIHETGSSQFVCSVTSNHKRIGEPHHDGAQLAHHDWYADAQKVGIV